MLLTQPGGTKKINSKYTGYTKKNGAVSKVNKKFISHLTQAQRTPSAVATVQVSHALPAVRFSHPYCGAAGPVTKMASQQEKVFCVLRIEVSRSVITVQLEFRVRFRKDALCMVRSKLEKRTAGSA